MMQNQQLQSISVMVLLVCRNRRETTLGALDRIRSQHSSITVSIAIFDDASDDGTPEAIMANYPDVTLVHGDGNAFWNGGLHKLWSQVEEVPVDAFLWLNDDTYLDSDAFEKLAYAWSAQAGEIQGRQILVGATRNLDGTLSYSGYRHEISPFAMRLMRVCPDPQHPIRVDTFNGNIVMIGATVVRDIGLNDPKFFHNLGDVDYGLRARAADIPVLLLPGTLGVCEGNLTKSEKGYGSASLSTIEQWRKVNTHHGLPFSSWLHFTKRHSGKWWLLHFFVPYRHLLKFWKFRGTRI